MRKDIHPEFKEVVFKDITNDFTYLTKSTLRTKDTIEYNGKEYPLIKAEISSESHPFYTGKQQVSAVEGRAARFKKKYGRGE